MKLARVIYHVVAGWIYLISLITGGFFVRRAQVRCGKRVKILPTVFFKDAQNIEIGDNTFINHLCSIWAGPKSSIRIGRDVKLGPGVCVIATDHGIERSKLIREQEWIDRDITIGNDVWIGAHVVVTGGVTIGDGCVVGAGSIVTKDLPPYSICVGVPARVLRQRTDGKDSVIHQKNDPGI